MNKLVEEAPYHPGYEDAVVSPATKYKGVDPAKMIWKEKPLSVEEIKQLVPDMDMFPDWLLSFARRVEERHGIK